MIGVFYKHTDGLKHKIWRISPVKLMSFETLNSHRVSLTTVWILPLTSVKNPHWIQTARFNLLHCGYNDYNSNNIADNVVLGMKPIGT
ncbi:hypothetical protein CAEBREN_15206 [Caenorhabditis brenneri]|uniref:Uncharacterized protein n=1 Tax=Caenorhabditis brenneri TaxID=135651 RepID=G0P2H8_CAEBE|nr:hypothetical protein CAEBREN_15206 [Caenorhabditis brenneri]